MLWNDVVSYRPPAILWVPHGAALTAQTCCKIPGPFPQKRHVCQVPFSCGADEHLTSPSFTSLLHRGKTYCPASPSFPWSSDSLSSGVNESQRVLSAPPPTSRRPQLLTVPGMLCFTGYVDGLDKVCAWFRLAYY